MTCPLCASWRATSEKAYAVRMRNVRRAPDVQGFRCGGCGTDDWMMSREAIVPEPEQPSKFRQFIRRLFR